MICTIITTILPVTDVLKILLIIFALCLYLSVPLAQSDQIWRNLTTLVKLKNVWVCLMWYLAQIRADFGESLWNWAKFHSFKGSNGIEQTKWPSGRTASLALFLCHFLSPFSPERRRPRQIKFLFLF